MINNILDYLRIGLYVLLAFICFSLYQTWQTEHQAPADSTAMAQPAFPDTMPRLPSAKTVSTAIKPTSNPATPTAIPANRIVHVKTNVLDVEIDTLGGDIISANLLKYSASLHNKTPVALFNNHPEKRYVAQSGLLSESGPDNDSGKALYKAEQPSYTLAEGQNELVVKLYWQNKEGVKFTKSFSFHRNNYEIDVAYQIDNHSSKLWAGNLYNQLLSTDTPPTNSQGFSNLTTYFGAAISSPEKHFQKITFKDMRQQQLNQSITGGWAAMIQHYFVSAWIPKKNTISTYYSHVTPEGLYAIGMIGPNLNAEPNQVTSVSTKLYAGPALADHLEKAAPGLQLTIDYGIFWFISVAVFWLMQKIHDVIGNWGWAIVFTTLIIKLLFYQLSAKSYRSMSMLKKIQPRLERLKEQYGNDRQKLTQATLGLYRQEKVNPMGGCLPILIQIPVFIALYWVLVESVQLRQAPFMLWIQDLTARDPYYVLPILVGLSMFLQQRLSPPPPDPTQAKVMMFMPVIFTVLFINFPAGLMLYWLVNNMLSFLQQWYIMRTVK